MLHITTYDNWWTNINKKTRNLIRKAQKEGLEIEIFDTNIGIMLFSKSLPTRRGLRNSTVRIQRQHKTERR